MSHTIEFLPSIQLPMIDIHSIDVLNARYKPKAVDTRVSRQCVTFSVFYHSMEQERSNKMGQKMI